MGIGGLLDCVVSDCGVVSCTCILILTYLPTYLPVLLLFSEEARRN